MVGPAGTSQHARGPTRRESTKATAERAEGRGALRWSRRIAGSGSRSIREPLPRTTNFAGPPVDVLEVQPGDLAAAQPQPGQQQQDHVVAPADRCRAITAIKQQPRLPGRNPARQILPPARDRRHRRRQRCDDYPLRVQKPQQRAQRTTVISADRAGRRRASRNRNVLTSAAEPARTGTVADHHPLHDPHDRHAGASTTAQAEPRLVHADFRKGHGLALHNAYEPPGLA